MKFHQNHIIKYIFLKVCIIIFVCDENGRVLKGEAQGMGEFARPGQEVYSTLPNFVSSQRARGKPSIARKPEDHPKIFKW